MTKLDYLDALRKALAGLPPATIAKTLAYYEQRFVDGAGAGRSEAEVYAELDEPRKIAMTLRASRHLQDFRQRRGPVSLLRMLVSAVGLALFNLFMLIPAVVYGALLLSLYLSALSLYVGGIAVTASGLSGQNELALEGPLHHALESLDSDGQTGLQAQTKVWIDEHGVRFYKEKPLDTGDEDSPAPAGLLDRAERVASGGVHITTELDSGARATQVAAGFGLLLAGIVLCLLSIVVSKYTMIGLRRYLAMNLSLLRGR